MAEEKDLKLAALEKGFEQMQQRIEALEAENATLKAATTPTEEKPKPKVPEETVKVGNKKYKFLVPRFRFKKQKYIAQDELENTDLHKALIEFNATKIFAKA